jgi:ribosome-binding factor A
MSGRRRARPPSQRQLRVGEEVRHALVRVLERGKLRDPGLEGVAVTVTEVRMTPDLRRAHVFVTPLGGGPAESVLAALARARSFLRRQVAQAVNLKYVPDMDFAADDSFDQAGRIETLLANPIVAQDLARQDLARRDLARDLGFRDDEDENRGP